MKKEQKLKSFHETIVKVIRRASVVVLCDLAMFIKTTKISRNHDKILIVWEKRTKAVHCPDFGVSTNLLEHKKMITKKKVAEKMMGARREKEFEYPYIPTQFR